MKKITYLMYSMLPKYSFKISLFQKKNSRQKRYSKFYPKRIIQKELSQNKSFEKNYPEDLSKNNFIQRLMWLILLILLDFIKLYKTICFNSSHIQPWWLGGIIYQKLPFIWAGGSHPAWGDYTCYEHVLCLYKTILNIFRGLVSTWSKHLRHLFVWITLPLHFG